ncbi:uncharacterized protein [Amphiura filiformis]|uniref:uncharacterized protein n=1 Tax=Amphiura filiformis TaxID=82378 RepID=UPI003B219145
MQSHLAKQLDVRPNYLSELSKSLDEDMMSKSRKRRSDATSMEVINEIQSFYRLPKVSRELPYMRTVKQQTQRRVMEVSIDQAYTMWKEEHPDHVTVVSRSLFQKLRPENVLLQHRNKLNQCLCEYCTDILLKLESLNRAAQVYEMPDIKVKNKYELIGLSMCPKNDGDNYAKPDCINRSCPECGTEKLRNRFTPLIAAHGDSMVQWRKWALQTYEHNGKTKAKKVLITQRKTISELVEELLNETETLAKHVFVANWQQDMFTEISTKLPQNWALLVLDFAENYGCLSQDEIQSAHWATQQVTVHPIAGYYNCVHSDATQSHIVQEAMVFISEDLGHDFHAVHHFEEVAVKHLKESRGLPLEHIVEYTDGCGCQYKSRGPFGDISYATEDYGVDDFERLYFGSRHGKGPSDGVSGVVKSAVRRAVVSRRAVINTAEEMYTYCKEELSRESCKGQRRRSSSSEEMKSKEKENEKLRSQ